ncbi:5-formyltetrahydrofolate cyclo-ligase [Pantoea vagans]|uniref:5-formyltetrahydrofolate cyclo-ligase n=1 Tax=Pantoea hericii TaxID=1815628 RepID=UPI000D7897BE|nr:MULTISPECIES: 5-formyltetrahydrofolate cyclo-ligase [Pantoea]AWP31759.1 5-formyltetrahydrofolate cyclo-ligase [Pantoea vagans]
MSSPSMIQRQVIRQQVRYLRRAMTEDQQAQAAEQLAELALNYAPITHARNIALFLSVDGELNTRPLIARLWHLKKAVYLPVLHPFSPGHLLFLRYTPDTPLHINKLRIPEPPLDIRQLITLDQLDLMMVPLVAFDQHGQRLGMGGGFYDRTLQNWRQHGFLPVGLAHDCQQVDSLPVAEWDVPLPAVMTPSKLWQWE